MSRYNQYPTMPCYCAKVHKTESRYAQNYNSSDTDEYDYSQKNISYPRSDYSTRSSHRYDNSSMLDDQGLSALTSLRQKTCRFITSETEDTLTDSPAYQPPGSCPRPPGGSSLLRRANDMIDYVPQSEFLKKMKHQCQVMTSDEPRVFFALEEGLGDEYLEYQGSRSSPRTEERIRYKSPPTRLPDAYNGEMLYKNSVYDPHCSTDEKLLDQLIDKKIPRGQDLEQSRKPDKKSEHISRSKKPVKCRGRRKRKSGSAEKCESEDQFEPTLKRPHENSCERCWRFASPSRSPVNRPDQKYDPNFRRGHSCYDFERGDGEFYDRHISPCKNLQQITSREKQEESPAVSVTFKNPLAQPVPSTWQRSPERPLTVTSSGARRADVQSRSSTPEKSPEGQVPRVGSAGRRSQEVQTQAASSYHRSPEGKTQTASAARQKSSVTQPQTPFSSSWQKSPEAQPQTPFSSSWQKCPEAQPQTPFSSSRQRSPETQAPQTPFSSTWPRSSEVQPLSDSSYLRSSDERPQKSYSIWHKSPETLPPQAYHSINRPRTPEAQPLSDSSYLRSSDDRPQKSYSIWHKSPETLPPQAYHSINRPRTPEAQPQTPFSTNGSRLSEVQPPSDYSCLRSPDDSPQKSYSIWHKSPETLPPQAYHSINGPRTPEAQPQTPFSTNSPRVPEVEPPSDYSYLRSPNDRPQKSYSIWHRSPQAQIQTPICNWPRPPEIQPLSDSSGLRSSDDRPQKSYSIWHRSPQGPPPQTPLPSTWQTPPPSTWQTPPEVQHLSDSSSYLRSSDGRPQKSYSIWHRSPQAPPPQTPLPSTWQTPPPSTWQTPPEVQQLSDSSSYLRSSDGRPRKSYSIWQRPPENKPQMYPPEAQPAQRSFIQQRSPMQPGNQDFPAENCGSSSMPLPERNVSGGQPLDVCGRPTCAVPQGVSYSDPRQTSGPISHIPGVSLADIKRCSEGIDDLNLTEYKTIAIRPREEFHDSANTSLPDRSHGHMTPSTVGENMHSPRQPSPPRPCPIGLGTIPEAADSDSSTSKVALNNKSSKSVTVKSVKSPDKEEASKADTTRQSNGSSPKKKSNSPKRPSNGGSPSKPSKSPSRSGNGSPKKSKSPSPKPGGSKQDVVKSPPKSPRKSPKAEIKRVKSLENVKSTEPPTPEQRPQSSDPRVREPILRRDRIGLPEQYQGLDHEIRTCSCGPEDSFAHDLGQGNYLVCCHCQWEKINDRSPKSPRNGYANTSQNRSRQSNNALSDKPLAGNSSRRGSPFENKSQSIRGYDGRTFECPHRRAANLRDEQPLESTVNSSFERDCRLLSELQNTPSFQSTFQGMSPIPHSPRTYFMFYMTKSNENKGDDDVEVLVEELTQPCPKKTDSRTKDITEKMKKIMECPSDSMALRFQKGVSDQCKVPQSSRVLYF